MTPSDFGRGQRVRVTSDRTGTVEGLIESPPGNPWGIHVRFDDEPRFSSEVNFNSGLTIETEEGEPMSEIRALSLTQPWASLIALGAKQMETRSWPTKYRGPVLIHAAKSMPCKVGETLYLGEWSVERDSRTGLLLRGPISHPYRLPLSCIVAVAELFQVRSTNSPEHGPDNAERALGDHSRDRYAWSLSSVDNLKSRTIPATGRLGLWRPDPELIVAVSEVLDAKSTSYMAKYLRIAL